MSTGDRIRRTSAAPPGEGPFRRPSGRVSYPHRMSLDLDDAQYRWLRAEARDARVSASGLIRAVLDELREDPEACARVRDRADADDTLL